MGVEHIMTTELTFARANELAHWNGTIGIEGEEGEHEIVVRIPFETDKNCHMVYDSVMYLEG